MDRFWGQMLPGGCSFPEGRVFQVVQSGDRRRVEQNLLDFEVEVRIQRLRSVRFAGASLARLRLRPFFRLIASLL